MNFKKITALTIAFNCLTTIVPSTLSVGTTAVYAASKGEYLKDIDMETNKDKNVYVCTRSSCESKYRISKLDSDDKVPLSLYAKVPSNVSKVKFTSIEVKDGYNYKIFKGSDEIDTDDDVRISSSTTFKIKIYKDGESSVKETYTVKVSKESDNDDDNDNDDIYLDDLTIKNNDGNKVSFSFKRSTTSYDINVNNDVTYVKICAKPDDDEYTVKIDGSEVTDSDDWTKKINLNEGNNEIPIKITDDDDNKRTYTLNIKRASKTQNTNNNNSSSNNTTTTTTVQKPSVNTPTFPTTQTGWVARGSNWYFVHPDGTCATGWVQSPASGLWYYMDTNTGIMKTGWVQVPNGKWYYFNGNGAMLKNTNIGQYRLGADGAWIQ